MLDREGEDAFGGRLHFAHRSASGLGRNNLGYQKLLFSDIRRLPSTKLHYYISLHVKLYS